MVPTPRPGVIRRAFGRLVPDAFGRQRQAEPEPTPDLRLPEQRLLDVAARYGRMAIGDRPPTSGQSAAAKGVRIVAPTDPSDAGAPVWVRRLGDRDSSNESAPATPEPELVAPSAPRGPRPR